MKTLSIHTKLDELPFIVPMLRTWKELAANDALRGKSKTDIPPMSRKRENMELWWQGKETFATDWRDSYALSDALRDVLWLFQHQDREFTLEDQTRDPYEELAWCENSHDVDTGLCRHMACSLVHNLWQSSFHFLEKSRRFFFKCTGKLVPACAEEDNRWYFLMTGVSGRPTEDYRKEGWCPVDQKYLVKGGV